MTVPTISLGDNLTVSTLGFGGMALSGVYGGAEPSEALKTLHHAVDQGITFIDTADVYGDGENERLVGKLLQSRRADVTVATKFGITGSIAEKNLQARNDASYIRQAVDASLERLGIETIDLYYLHRRQVDVPLEEPISALADLVKTGKIRHIGLSEVTAAELEEAHTIHPITAVQSEWSLWSRDVENTVVPTAARLGIGFVPYSPLGRGFLTGTLRDPSAFSGDWREGLSRFTGDAFARNQQVLSVIDAVANAHQATPAQIALAWLFAAGRRFELPVAPIPGTRRVERVDENIGALNITLNNTDITALEKIADSVTGPRSDNPDLNWTSSTRE